VKKVLDLDWTALGLARRSKRHFFEVTPFLRADDWSETCLQFFRNHPGCLTSSKRICMDLCIENNDRRYDIKARSYFQYVKSGARLKERASGASLMRCA